MGSLAPASEGNLVAQGHRVALCVSRFNGLATERLLEGATDALVRHGADPADLSIYRCAGTFELGALAARVARAGKIDGLVALGCLIRGSTDHYHLLAGEITRAMGQIALECATSPSPIAVSFGVLTCENLEQAFERAGSKQGNKGFDAAQSCIEQINLLRAIKG